MQLSYGYWTSREQVADPVWSGWFVGENRQNRNSAWLRCIGARELSSECIKQAAPSTPLANSHARVSSANLQAVYEPEIASGGLLLAVEPMRGTLLADLVTAGRLSTPETLSIVHQCLSGLEALHAAGIVHGRVLPDRIYLNSDGEVRLARDPLCRETIRLDVQALGVLQPKLPRGLYGAHFLAPEFLIPGNCASMSSDIYALGSLWWLLLVGTPPASGGSEQAILAAHAQRRKDVWPKLELAEPLQKCLRYCLAKNPTARFPDARSLRLAFDQAQRCDVNWKNPSTLLPMQVSRTVAVNSSEKKTDQLAKPVQSTKPAAPQFPPRSESVRRRGDNRTRGSKWMLPVLSGSGLLVVLLLGINFSGLLWRDSSGVGSAAKSAGGGASELPPVAPPQPIPRDVREDHFEIVAQEPKAPWAPPTIGKPLPLDLLPHGGQLFVSVRPSQLFAQPTTRKLLAIFDADVASLWEGLRKASGQQLESIEQCLIAGYPEKSGTTLCALRIRLSQPKLLAELRASWGKLSEQKVGSQALLVSDAGFAYYVPNQPLVDSQSVTEFSFGPSHFMKDVVEAAGLSGPLTSRVERLWQATDSDSDLCILASGAFLFGDGRRLLDQIPRRIVNHLRDAIGNDVRAVMLRTSFEPTWYYELRTIGTSDREAGRLSDRFKRLIGGSPAALEAWFVDDAPHPYWRALALRYSRMLAILDQHTRAGVENGESITNGYLPSIAASNLLLATWIAAQEFATIPSMATVAGPSTVPASKPLDIEGYLGRAIDLRFEQESIEVALQLIAGEANTDLPSATPKLRFELDGDAFEKSGITRNQQIRNFQHVGLPMRDALTALAKRGNPDPSVTDLRQENQKLVWVVQDDSNSPGQKMISLTTREAAQSAKVPLPIEFAPP